MGAQTALFSTPEPATTPTPEPATPATPASPGPTMGSTNQPKYGKELGLPGTYVRCGRCATSYAIAADDLGSGPGR